MKYLSVEVCELLHKLGVKCETGMWWVNPSSFWKSGEYQLFPEGYTFHKTSGLTVGKDPDVGFPAFSLPLLIPNSEAMQTIFGWELQVYLCGKCGFDKPYSKHDDHLFCPVDGRKLKQTTKKMSFREGGGSHKAHELLDLCLSGDYEAAEPLLVEALTERTK